MKGDVITIAYDPNIDPEAFQIIYRSDKKMQLKQVAEDKSYTLVTLVK